MPTDTLSTSLAAVADPTRRAILERLRGGEATVTELAAPFAMSLPAISKHLKVLERAGLLTRDRQAQWRPCRLRPEGLRAAADWLEAYRALWEARLDRMEAYLDELQRGASATPAAKSAAKITAKPTAKTPATTDAKPAAKPVAKTAAMTPAKPVAKPAAKRAARAAARRRAPRRRGRGT